MKLTTFTRKNESKPDRFAELMAAAARRQEAMLASGYVEWVASNLARGEGWARQDTGLVRRTKLSREIEKKGLKRSRKLRKRQGEV